MKLRNASLFEDVFTYKSKEGSNSSKWTVETMNEKNHESNHGSNHEFKPRCSKKMSEKLLWKWLYTIFVGKEIIDMWRNYWLLLRILIEKVINSEIDSILHNHAWKQWVFLLVVNLYDPKGYLNGRWQEMAPSTNIRPNLLSMDASSISILILW